MIDQVTVFLVNSEGRLSALCRTLADAGINMSALTIADTAEYGLVRIICDDPARAVAVLKEADYHAVTTKVCAIAVPNHTGGLAALLATLDELDLNIEYGYCFSLGDQAVDVLKVRGAQEALAAIEAAGFRLLSLQDLAQ